MEAIRRAAAVFDKALLVIHDRSRPAFSMLIFCCIIYACLTRELDIRNGLLPAWQIYVAYNTALRVTVVIMEPDKMLVVPCLLCLRKGGTYGCQEQVSLSGTYAGC